MFGYIKLDAYAPKPYVDYFRKNYCFLCRALSKYYGVLSRLFVSFDVTFFAVLFSDDNYLSKLGKVPCVKSSNALKEKLADEYAKKLAALNMALAAGELIDNIGDRDKFYAKPVYFAYKGVFKKVKKEYPQLWEIVEDGHKRMSAVEKSDGKIEEIEDCFAKLIERVAVEFFGVEDKAKISVIKYIAKMLYFMDAVDDIDKDIKRNSYNGLKKYGSKSEYVFCNYRELDCHLTSLRSEVLPLTSHSVNVGTVKRVLDFGIPEMLLKICYKGIRL